MKIRQVLIGFVAGSVTTVLAAGALLSPQDPTEAEMAKMWQEAMEKYGTPTAEHEALAKRQGAWECDMKYWETPGGDTKTMTGRANFEMLMDGRYLLQHFESEFDGMPFEGAGVTGFDRMKQKYDAMWIDNMGTSFFLQEGAVKGDLIEYHGKMPNPMAGEYVPARSTEEVIDDDTFIVKMYMPDPDGKMFKHMEITYNRVKSKGAGY